MILLRQGGPAVNAAHQRLVGAVLTPRETEVLSWLAKGKTNRDIADILGMSPRTVNKHLEHIFEKLGGGNAHGGSGDREQPAAGRLSRGSRAPSVASCRQKLRSPRPEVPQRPSATVPGATLHGPGATVPVPVQPAVPVPAAPAPVDAGW